MTNTNELTAKLRHWASMASVTNERVSCLSVEQLTEVAEALEDAEKRIAELEARTLTVKLPQDEEGQQFGFAKWANSKLPASTGTMTISYCEDAWREALEVFAAAAGVNVEFE